MTEFQALPADQVVDLVARWALLDWPVTLDQARQGAADLGWTPCGSDPDILDTHFGLGDEEALLVGLRGVMNDLTINLSNLAPFSDETRTAASAAFEAYVVALTDRFGSPDSRAAGDDGSATWVLRSGASIELGLSTRFVEVVITSPEWNQTLAYAVDEEAEAAGEHEDEEGDSRPDDPSSVRYDLTKGDPSAGGLFSTFRGAFSRFTKPGTP